MRWMINIAGDAGASLCGPGGCGMWAVVSIDSANFMNMEGDWDSHYHEGDDSK